MAKYRPAMNLALIQRISALHQCNGTDVRTAHHLIMPNDNI